MMHTQIEEFLLAQPDVWVDCSMGEGSVVYKYGQAPEGKIVAVVAAESRPLRVSLKCDPLLAKTLREKYESVLPASDLNKKYWNTIICSGQLTDEEVIDLARLSYRLVSEEETAA